MEFVLIGGILLYLLANKKPQIISEDINVPVTGTSIPVTGTDIPKQTALENIETIKLDPSPVQDERPDKFDNAKKIDQVIVNAENTNTKGILQTYNETYDGYEPARAPEFTIVQDIMM